VLALVVAVLNKGDALVVTGLSLVVVIVDDAIGVTPNIGRAALVDTELS